VVICGVGVVFLGWFVVSKNALENNLGRDDSSTYLVQTVAIQQ
jgi:hypothetical protein